MGRSSGPPRRLWRASLANLALLAALWGAESLVGERHWLATGLTYMPQQPLGLPTLLLLFLSVRRREPRALALNLAAGALFAFTLLGVNVPRRTASNVPGAHVRVMTLNMHHGRAGAERILRLVRGAAPDILCLQEATPDPGRPDPLPGILEGLPGWSSARAGDVATLSRSTILSEHAHPSPVGDGRAFLETPLDVAGTRLTVLNVHFSTSETPEGILGRIPVPCTLRHTAEVRSRQVDAALDIAGRTAGPLLVAGDLNTPPRGRLYRRLRGTFADAFADAGRGMGNTFHARLPLLRIDYVLTTGGIQSEHCRASHLRVSDHYAVIADLVLPSR